MARRVAVLLNRRAQGVTEARVHWFREQVAPDDLVVTDDVEAGRTAVKDIARAGYDVLVLGGGDGTVMAAAEALVGEPHVPALLPLRLGTGNATHDVCGSSPPSRRGLARDLKRAADPDEVDGIAPLSFLEVDGRIAQFAGVGLDADWAADYAWLVKKHVGNGRWLPLVRGVPGYVVTAATMTIPRLLRRPHVQVRVIADAPVQRLDDNGRPIAAFAAGDIVYAGPAVLVAVSTVPSYNAGMRFFRHVDALGGAFELKIAVASALEVLRRVGRVLRGEPDPSVFDFAARAVTIELAEPYRYHVGGDVLAPARSISVRTSRHVVPVLRGAKR